MKPISILSLSLFILVCSLNVYGKETKPIQEANLGNDTTMVKDLEEIVVEGRTQRVITDGVEYIPGNRIKQNSFDALSLLRNMHIPSIILSDNLENFRTISGYSISFYINYRPARESELNNLRTSDVIKIDVLKAPTDPRFKGEPAVINIITRQYEYGGYTSLRLSGQTLIQDQFEGTLYSKYISPKWSFDISAGGSAFHSNDFRSTSTEVFRNLTFNNQYYPVISRVKDISSSLNQNNAQWALFRFIYSTKKTYIEHILSYKRKGNPCRREKGVLSFQPAIINDTELSIQESNQSIIPTIEAYYNFTLNDNTELTATWDFTASFNRHAYHYKITDESRIFNNNREKTLQPNASIMLTKKFGYHNLLRILLSSFNDIFHTEYSGSFNELQKLYSSESFALAQYSHTFSEKFRLDSQIGLSYAAATINGKQTLNEWNPRIGLGVYYTASSKLNLSLEGGWFNNHPSPSDITDAIVRKDELILLNGNPDIKNTLGGYLRLATDYIPTNWLSLAMGINYNTNRRLRVNNYYTLPGYDGIICKKINSGNFHSYSAIIGATAKLFENTLIIGIQGSASRNILTGMYASHRNLLNGNIEATCYFGKFSASLYAKSPEKTFGAWDSGMYSKGKTTYGIQLTFGNDNFKAQLAFNNWMRKRGGRQNIFNSPIYSFHSEECDPASGLGRNLTLHISYTISYGRKLSKNNEIESSKEGNSAILR